MEVESEVVQTFTETMRMQTSLQPEGKGGKHPSSPAPTTMEAACSSQVPVWASSVHWEGRRDWDNPGHGPREEGSQCGSLCLLEATERHTLQQKVSFQQPGWFVTQLPDSYSAATDIATEQEVAIELRHLIAQLSDAGNKPFEFLYSMGGDFLTPLPPKRFLYNNAGAEN